MSKILYIKANPKSDEKSRTFKIADKFLKTYKELHPQDEIIAIDLYKEKVHPLSEDEMNSLRDIKKRNNPIVNYANQFKEADKYLIAAPMWNLSFPSILKAYIDYIVVSGITFNYTQSGPVGLCTGKKALYIVARGGDYSHGAFADYEMGVRYLKTIFGFMGITDFTTIAANNLDIVGADVDKILAEAYTAAQNAAESF